MYLIMPAFGGLGVGALALGAVAAIDRGFLAYEIMNEVVQIQKGVSHWNSDAVRAEQTTRDFRRGCANGSIKSKDCPSTNENANANQSSNNLPQIPQEYFLYGFAFIMFMFLII